MVKTIVFSDLDGTALNEKFTFSPNLVEVVSEMYKGNMYFIPVTARSTNDAMRQAKELNLDKLNGIFAANNGAQIYDFKTNKFIVDKRLDKEFIKNIFNFTYNNFKYKVHYFADDVTYVYGHGDNSAYWSKIMKVDYKIVKTLAEIDKPISHLTIILEKSATNEQAEEFYKGFRKYYPNVEIIKYTNRVFEVTSKGINKGFAVEFISNYLKINKNICTTYAFGDSHNDFELFFKVDKAIAVENAMSQLIGIADDVTDSNDRDGVANYIKKNIIINREQ